MTPAHRLARSTPRESPAGFAHRAGGIVFVVTALMGAIVGVFLLGRLEHYLNDPANADALDAASVPDAIMLLIEHRILFVILTAPALIGGVLLALGARPRKLWYALGALGVLLIIAVLIISLLGLLAPLYTYQEL